MGVLKYLFLLFVFFLQNEKAVLAMLSATILNSKLPIALAHHRAIYDGRDSIFIFGGYIGIGAGTIKQILHFNISNSKITIAGEMPDTQESGILALDGYGDIFYFGVGLKGQDVYKFNSETKSCEIVTTLPLDVSQGSVNYNQTHILILGRLGNSCKTVLSFNIKTYESTLIKNGSSFTCRNLFVPYGNEVLIYGDDGLFVTLLDLTTFQEKRIFADFLNLRSYCSFVRAGSDVYIINTFDDDDQTKNYKHGLIKIEWENLLVTFLPVEGFILSGKEYFEIPPTMVFVEKLNRIYFFGGRSAGNFNSESLRNDIWYIDLSLKYEKYENHYGSLNIAWILALSLFILVNGVTIYGIYRSSLKSIKGKEYNIPDFIEEFSQVWKSAQSLQLLSREPIGKGSFAEVYKARHSLHSNLYFAIKKILVYKALQHMQWDIQKVLREVEHLSEIVNPNVIRMWNCWMEEENGAIVLENATKKFQFKEWSSTQDCFLFLQMELCDSTLRDWLTVNHTFEKRMEKDVKGIMSQIVNGLRAIHEKGIIHRDIKPNNIFYCENGNLWKIGDLGLSAKATESSIAEHTIAGCQLYRCPEMDLSNETAIYNFKSDVFSLGLTFIEMICIFKNGGTSDKVFEYIRIAGNEKQLEGLENFVEILFTDLFKVVSKMLVKNPGIRIDIFDRLIDNSLFLQN